MSVELRPSILVRALCLLLCRLSCAVPHFSEGCRLTLLFPILISLWCSHNFIDASLLLPAVPSNTRTWADANSLWVTSGSTAPVPVPHLQVNNFISISNLNLPSLSLKPFPLSCDRIIEIIETQGWKGPTRSSSPTVLSPIIPTKLINFIS